MHSRGGVIAFEDPAIAAVFEAYPAAVRRRMLRLRALVFEVAAAMPEVGALQETLKWGEPAYLTRRGIGSTVRMDWKAKHPEHCALYFHCQTDLVHTFRTLFPNELKFEGQRALLLPLNEPLPQRVLWVCIGAALTYHLRRLSIGA